LALLVVSSGATSVHVRLPHRVRQHSGSAHDRVCNKAMCIEASVEGDTARYVLRSTNDQALGWMAVGFGRFMADSAMVIMWPSRDADNGSYTSPVTLSQRKAPYETMPKPDPDPPFIAALDPSTTSVTGEYPQMAFTRPAPADGMQDIIWAFSRTPPESADANTDLFVHHKFGRTVLNLTRTAAPASEHSDAPPSSQPVPAPEPSESAEAGHGESEDEDEDEDEHLGSGASSSPSDAASQSTGTPAVGETGTAVAIQRVSFASFVHAVLCTAAFLLVIPSGALVVRYAKVTGSSAAFGLHRKLQFGVAGASIAGGMLAYLFMDNDNTSIAHKGWGAALVLLYGVQCVVGFWVNRIPAESRTRAHSTLLAGLGASVVLLAFYDAWLGFAAVSEGPPLFWSMILFVAIPSLYVVGVVVIRHRFGSVLENAKGEYVALDSRGPNEGRLN